MGRPIIQRSPLVLSKLIWISAEHILSECKVLSDIFSKLRELRCSLWSDKIWRVTGKEVLLIVWGVFRGKDDENDLKPVEVIAMKLQILLKSFELCVFLDHQESFSILLASKPHSGLNEQAESILSAYSMVPSFLNTSWTIKPVSEWKWERDPFKVWLRRRNLL